MLVSSNFFSSEKLQEINDNSTKLACISMKVCGCLKVKPSLWNLHAQFVVFNYCIGNSLAERKLDEIFSADHWSGMSGVGEVTKFQEIVP